MFKIKTTLAAVMVGLSLSGCSEPEQSTSQTSSTVTEASSLTAADAKAFLEQAQNEIAKIQLPAAHAQWSYATNINVDTAAVSAYLGEQLSTKVAQLAKEAPKFNDVEVDADTRRKLDLLRNGLTMPPPSDPEKSERLAKIGSDLDGMYGAGEYCRDENTCFSLVEMSSQMATSRDYDLLLEFWKGWREVAVPMKPLYEEQVALANEGAEELGFANVSELWRGKYDMPADDFSQELDRLWGQVEPFYEALHCHVRAKLGEHYGTDNVPQDKPIPAHLLGNMWAQTWGNVYDLVKPEQEMVVPDVTGALKAQGYDEIKMVKQAESFSLHLDLRNCLRHSGSDHSFRNLRVATCSVMRQRGILMIKTICELKCVFKLPVKNLALFTMNWDTTIISELIKISPCYIAVRPMTDSTKPLAIPSHYPLRQNTSSKLV